MTYAALTLVVHMVTVHWAVDPKHGPLGQCEAVMACTDSGCEALVIQDTCTQPWGLEQCLESSVAVPGDDVGDTLGCDPSASVLVVDYTINP